MSKRTLAKAMNVQLANWNVLNTKLHHYHWFVKGPEFFTLHDKFEEIYNEAATNIDEIAERMLMIGAEPVSALRSYLDLTTLEEARGGETAKEMLEYLTNDFEQLIDESSRVINLAEENNDHPSADMFIGIKASLEKHNWMLNSYLGKGNTKATINV